MKKTIPFIWITILCLISQTSQSQSTRLVKLPIGESGCSFYNINDEVTFELTQSPDSSEVWVTETGDSVWNYSVICIKFRDLILESEEEKLEMLESYLDFLQEQFVVYESAGYGEGHTLESHPSAVGVLDFWTDIDDLSYAVKGWCDENYLAVMLVYGDEAPPIDMYENFVNGFRFP